MKLLCIDDSATLRKIVSMAMKSAGYGFAEAENGRIGLERLVAEKPDCVLLDVNMPEMGGLEFLKAKAADPRVAAIPVLVLTTESDDAMRAQAKALGAAGFLAKPFQKETLLSAIAAVV